jgi:ribosomal protein S18 acetylase RimI-like enzyme
MTVTLRPVERQDAGPITRLEQDLARTPGGLASRPHEVVEQVIAARIAARSPQTAGGWLVAESEGVLVGHGVLEPLTLEVTRHVVALTLAVDRAWQGRGVGTMLLESLLSWARATPHVEKVELRVRASNSRAIGLYRKLGFVEEGRFVRRIKLATGDYVDDLSMGLWVGP